MLEKVNPRAVLLLGVVLSSSSSTLIRLGTMSSLALATWRLGWSVVLLLPIILLRERQALLKTAKRDVLVCAGAGACLGLHFALWFESLRWTSVASSMVLVATEVIFSALGFALLLKGYIPKLGVLAIGITFGGSALLALADQSGPAGALKGDLMALVAAVLVAAYTLIGRVQRARQSTNSYTFLTYTFCLVTLLLFDAVTQTPLLPIDGRNVAVTLAMAVLCTLMGHSVFTWTLKWLSPAYVSAVKLLGTVLASGAAYLLFHERMQPLPGWTSPIHNRCGAKNSLLHFAPCGCKIPTTI